VIEVSDDGAGISTERVLAKAIERGLVAPERAASMTQRETLQVIFLAGFSTAKEVTSVSGRGVGLDVVRANMEKVGGSVDIESHAGAGTTVRLRVPLTLAIVPALVVQSGGQSFALPQSSLTELVYLAPHDAGSAIQRMGTAELYRLRESLLPLIWLDRVLGLEESAENVTSGHYIAVLETDGRRFGLVVDDLKAPEEIVVKPLSTVLREIGMFSGATVLANGMLALILDVAAIGVRAGVRLADDAASVIAADTESKRGRGTGTGEAAIEMESSLVIYETWKSGSGPGRASRMAMPLSSVERIERIPFSRIEYAGGKPVLQYAGELLSLQDEDEVLAEMRAANNLVEDAHAMATVLICMRPGPRTMRRVGVVVRRVLDVSAGTMLPLDRELCDGELAMVQSRVTTMHRGYAQQVGRLAPDVLQEVA
jgi:two-component system chemotaxis sensor kinase CheA